MKHNSPSSDSPPPLGRVYFVGAGPGDPGLLTLRGFQCLQKADLVIADRLVHPRIFQYVRASAEIFYCCQHGQTAATPQERKFCHREEIVSKMIQEAQKGKVVIRLKGGCPELFARQSEELALLRQAGIPYEIVPGITAGLAAAAYAEIPLTDSELSSAVALATGHERSGKQGLPLDYETLAQFPGTLVVYMGGGTARQWSEALLRGGRSPQTPVAIIRRCTWPDQQTIRCQLGNLPETIAAHQVQPPAVIIVGEVVSRAPETPWFQARPLFGQRILLTRPEEQSQDLADQLAELGADVLIQPAIRIADPPDWRPVDEALARLGDFDWVVFSSANGVRYFLDRLLQTGGDLRRFGRVRLAAIGPGTAAQLVQYHLRADLVPEEFQAEALAEALLQTLGDPPSGKRVLLVRASRGRPVLAEMLQSAGVEVHQIVAYTSADVTEPVLEIAQALADGAIHWVTVTSSSIARSLVQMFGEDLRKAKLASISPITSGVLRELGYAPAVEAKHYTLPGLVEALLEETQKNR